MREIQTLAIWGGPGSGKTTTAIKLAQELAAHKKNVAVVLCDFLAPAPQTLQPKVPTAGKSLGDLLTQPTISQEAILSRCIPFGNTPYVSLLGYQSGDNAFTYAQYAKERAIDLLTLLRHCADYVLIDCNSSFSSDVLSAVALENADAVLRLAACDLKSMSYFSSALPLLADSRFASGRHIRALSCVKPGQDSGEYSNNYGGVSYTLPYVPELEEQFFTALLADALCSKGAQGYTAVIHQIAADLLLDSEDTGKSRSGWHLPKRSKEPKEKTTKHSLVLPLRKEKPKKEKQTGSLFERLGKGGKS